jgi:hypothetical protein
MAAGDAEGRGLVDALLPLATPEDVVELVREGVENGVRVEDSDRVIEGVVDAVADDDDVRLSVSDGVGVPVPGSSIVGVSEAVDVTEGVSDVVKDVVSDTVLVMVGDEEDVGVMVRAGVLEGVNDCVAVREDEAVPVELIVCDPVRVTDADTVLVVDGSATATTADVTDSAKEPAES